MSASPAKKSKPNYSHKKAWSNPRSRDKIFLSPGLQGFLVTCNFREKDCIREAYTLLNEYADKLFPVEDVTEANQPKSDKPAAEKDSEDDDDDDDISKQVEKDVAATKTKLENRKFRFKQADTGAQNCLFIKADVPDVVELGVNILREIAETKQAKTKNILRLLPIEAICKANMKDIADAAGKLFDKYLLKEPKTFAIVFNRRMNNNMVRDDVIKELADMITAKNIENKVDLKHAAVTVLVEVIKGHCCLSVLPDYFKLKKYNLTELVLAENAPKDQ